MGGQNCSSKTELKKGPWTREEDHKLLAYVEIHGCGSWRTLPAKAGLQRCGKSCRLRWTNYLRPDIARGKFSTQEEKAIIRLHALLGNRWSTIAAHLPKRTDNEIKNYWNTRLKKRLTRMGIDPTNHKPKHDQAKSAALSHMAQWEAARLEAEARLARDSKRLPLLHKLTSPPPQPLRMASPPCLDVLRVWQSSTLQRRFFSSAGSSSLQSPTSTLNSSSSSRTVPAVSSIVANDVISTNDDYDACRLRRVDDSYQLHGEHMTYTDCGLMGPLDLAAFNHDSDGCSLGGPIVGEPEDSKNFWDYLLNLVNSPMMESPKL